MRWFSIALLIAAAMTLGWQARNWKLDHDYAVPAQVMPMPYAWQILVVPPGQVYTSANAAVGPTLKQALASAGDGTLYDDETRWKVDHYVMAKPCTRTSSLGPSWDVYCDVKRVGPDPPLR